MKIYSNRLTPEDLTAACPAGTYLHSLQCHRPRKTEFSYTAILASHDEARRYGNSGGYGAASYRAPTWDEYGLWIDALFAIDYDAIIGPYHGRYDFRDQTCEYVNDVYADPLHKLVSGEMSQYAREHSGPWLEAS